VLTARYALDPAGDGALLPYQPAAPFLVNATLQLVGVDRLVQVLGVGVLAGVATAIEGEKSPSSTPEIISY
jgi:hypothetical protein